MLIYLLIPCNDVLIKIPIDARFVSFEVNPTLQQWMLHKEPLGLQKMRRNRRPSNLIHTGKGIIQVVGKIEE